MSDRKKILKKNLLKEVIKLIAPLFLIVGIFVGIIYLSCNNVFMAFLRLWLAALDINLIAIYYLYLEKDDLQSPITKRRLDAINSNSVYIYSYWHLRGQSPFSLIFDLSESRSLRLN